MLEDCGLHYLKSQSGQVPVTLVSITPLFVRSGSRHIGPHCRKSVPQVRRQERTQNFFDWTDDVAKIMVRTRGVKNS